VRRCVVITSDELYVGEWVAPATGTRGPWPRMSPHERYAVVERFGIGHEFGATSLAQYIEYKTIAA
jgi:hypothetical protein